MPYKDIEANKAYQRAWAKKRYIENKKKALVLLGGKCARCSIDDYRVIQFDHIKQIFRRMGSEQSGANLIRDIVYGRADLTKLQALCANCHMIKTLEDYGR